MAKDHSSSSRGSAKERLLHGALSLIRSKGYAATSVDALCELAGVTKGAFFHHFKSKEDLAVAAADHWSKITGALFDAAPYHQVDDPLGKVLAYIAFRKQLLEGELPEFTCLVGTLVQETYFEHPKIQQACHASIFGHAATYEPYIEAAKKLYAPNASWSSRSLALHIQGTIQGAFILAKASGKVQDAIDSVSHLERYVRSLFSHISEPPQ